VMSARRESDRIGKGVRYPKERDGERRRGMQCRIASQALCPGESVMCPLCPRNRSIWRGLSWGRGVSYMDVNALVRKELYQLPPMETPLPVSPEHRMRNRWRKRLLWCRWGRL